MRDRAKASSDVEGPHLNRDDTPEPVQTRPARVMGSWGTPGGTRASGAKAPSVGGRRGQPCPRTTA
eukprot:3569037-Pyramimonas_sp.AAC.1